MFDFVRKKREILTRERERENELNLTHLSTTTLKSFYLSGSSGEMRIMEGRRVARDFALVIFRTRT